MAELKIVEGGKVGAVYALDPAREISLGRDPKADVALGHSKVSGRHAKVSLRDSGWILEDLQSTNGTFVNGRKITRVVLTTGDMIRIGSYVLQFVGGADARDAVAREEPLVELEPAPGDSEALVEAARRLGSANRQVTRQMGRIIVGQRHIVENLLVALFACGHVLLEGVPGLAKTLMVRTLAGILDLSFKRIQFTPDLMPSEVVGTEVTDEDPATHTHTTRFVKGPIFTNVLLADEINRTPPKTQAALVEVMQERRVTAAGTLHELPSPFFVLATRNPIEQEGTYPVSDAYLDRFMCECVVDYPSREEEVEILRTTTGAALPSPRRVLSAEEITVCQELVRALPVPDSILHYAADLARASRPGQDDAPDFVDRFVLWGAGPRAAQSLVLTAKARALLDGRLSVSIRDVKAVAHTTLRHRVSLNSRADAEGLTVDALIDRLLESVPEPEPGGVP